MQNIFKINFNDLQHYRPSQVTFGSNSLQSLRPQIWHGLPNEMKSAENLNSFKNMIKKWMAQNVNEVLVAICVSKLVYFI